MAAIEKNDPRIAAAYGPGTRAFELTHAPPSGPGAPTWPPQDVWTVSAPAMAIATNNGTTGKAGAKFLYRLIAGPGEAQGAGYGADAPPGRLWYGGHGASPEVGVAGPLGLPVPV
jgi:hypothetical protein